MTYRPNRFRPNRFDPVEHRAEGFLSAIGWLEKHGYIDAADALRGKHVVGEDVPIEWLAQVRWLWTAQLAIVRRIQRRLTPHGRQPWIHLADHFGARDPWRRLRFRCAAERALHSFVAYRVIADDFRAYVRVMATLLIAWEERILRELEWLAMTEERSEADVEWRLSRDGKDCESWARAVLELARLENPPWDDRGPQWVTE